MAVRKLVRRRARRASPMVRRIASPSVSVARAEARERLQGAGGLMVGGVRDPAETAADRLADQVMRMPESASLVQRACAECAPEEKARRQATDEEEEEPVRMRAAAARIAPGKASAPAPAAAKAAIGAMGTGRPLPTAERAFFEPRFGADLSSVRVHDDGAAARAARALHARAFTYGSDIALAPGEFQPGTHAGRQLLAHELTHVVQQTGEQLQRARTQAKEGAATGGSPSGREKGSLNFLFTMLGNRSVAQLIQAKKLPPEGKIVGLQRQLNTPPVAPTPPAGTLPTRQQLHAEVDLLFREFFPDAPKQLNPNDPKQADLVDTWLGVRDGILNQWTDKVFFSFFPNAPKRLDPNNTDDAQLIEFWGDIRHQIRDGPPGKYHWGPQTSEPAPTTRRPRTPGKTTTPAAAPPPLRVVDIHNYGRGRFALDFETEPTVKAAAAKVFPDGMPPGVTISLYGPKQILFEHITMDSLKSMPSWLASAFSQAAQGIEDDPMQRAAPKQEPARQQGKPHPEIDIDTPEALHSWLESAAHKAHEIGNIAELVELLTKIGENIAYNRLVAQVGVDAAEGVAWAGAGLSKIAQFHRVAAIAEVIGVISKFLSVVGDVALIIWVAYQLIEAFKAEKEGELRFGYLYGVMWEALGESDHVRVYENPGITYSAEELREAFVDGVAQGRKKGKELKIRNSIKLWVAAEAVHSGLGVWAAAHTVITEIYNKGQRHKSKWQLNWPTPFPYTGIVGMIAGE